MRPVLLIPGVVLGLGLTVASVAAFRDTADQPPARPTVAGQQEPKEPSDDTRIETSTSPTLPFLRSQPMTAAGRRYPVVPTNPQAVATLLAAVETALRDPSTPEQDLPDLGHQQQVIYRVLSADIPRSQLVLAALSDRWRSVGESHGVTRMQHLSSRLKDAQSAAQQKLHQAQSAAHSIDVQRLQERAREPRCTSQKAARCTSQKAPRCTNRKAARCMALPTSSSQSHSCTTGFAVSAMTYSICI